MSFYTEQMEQLKMASMRENHPDWIWSRSDTHMFLKVPEAHDAFVTVVEPGNSFSPGPGSYGISTWIGLDNVLYAPELYDLKDIEWEFESKKYPVSHTAWIAGAIQVDSYLFTCQVDDTINYCDYLRVRLSNKTSKTTEPVFYLTVRSFGAAGGPITKLEEKENIINVNGVPLIYMERKGKFGAVSYTETGKDISLFLKEGIFPESTIVNDPENWASGAICYRIKLEPGESIDFDFAFHIHAECELLEWLKPLTFPLNFDEKLDDLHSKWDSILTARISTPDPRIADTFNAQINHLYMAAGLDAPHISPITYPSWWMRDSAYICTALDHAGLHDFCKRSATHAGRYKTTCAFGSEADLQGSRIWVISEHYLLTRDKQFLEKNYQYITENAEEIMEMCSTSKPLNYFNETFTHQTVNSPVVSFTCGASRNGMCRGRMDGHFPLFYCNGFCYLGLNRASFCASELGKTVEADRYSSSAQKLKNNMLDFIPGHFARVVNKDGIYDSKHYNIYDTGTVFFPCNWGDVDNVNILKEYENYWDNYLCHDGTLFHEPLWTYLEINDTRNRLILGQRERVWKVIEHFFDTQTCPGMYTWHEGNKDENSNYLAWEKVRGWDKAPYVTPHGWTGALMLGMMRDIMVYDNENGEIYIGKGIPSEWVDKEFSIENFPTYYGNISYFYKPESQALIVSINETSKCKIISCLPFDVHIIKG